jgi:hypothetical protein
MIKSEQAPNFPAERGGDRARHGGLRKIENSRYRRNFSEFCAKNSEFCRHPRAANAARSFAKIPNFSDRKASSYFIKLPAAPPPGNFARRSHYTKITRTRLMNHCYKIIFNLGLGLWQAVSELAQSRGKSGRGSRIRALPCAASALACLAILKSADSAQAQLQNTTTGELDNLTHEVETDYSVYSSGCAFTSQTAADTKRASDIAAAKQSDINAMNAKLNAANGAEAILKFVQERNKDLSDNIYLTDSYKEQRSSQYTSSLGDPVISGAGTPNVAGSECVQQWDPILLALDSSSVATEIAGTALEAVGSANVFTSFPEIPGIVMQGAASALHLAQNVIKWDLYNRDVPDCNATFTGTVQTQANFAAKQGVSAMDGAINLGTKDGTGYYNGITIGGGEVAGAGNTGATAYTGDADAIAIGNGSSAGKADATALGTSASASGVESSYHDNQLVFGTAMQTLSAPGISSYLSKLRQVGQLNVLTTDAFGNLADDGGTIFRRLDGQEGGIAMAMAMENPSLGPNETFGFTTALGSYAGANAISAAAMGEIKRNVFLRGDRVSLFGGLGASFDNGRSGTTYGGRIGIQWTR